MGFYEYLEITELEGENPYSAWYKENETPRN